MFDEKTATETYEAIRAAAHREFEQTVRSHPDIIRQLRCAIRIEVNHDAEYALLSVLHRHYHRFDPRGKEGTMRLDDFDVYVVDQLPEPGWRVVNPFRDARAG